MTPLPLVPLLKIVFFSDLSSYKNFLLFTPSHILKVTKFLVEISQLKFLVMTEKNIFVYKYFCL